MKLKRSDIIVNVVFPYGALELSTIKHGERVSHVYYDYSRAEAIENFIEYVKCHFAQYITNKGANGAERE